MAKGGGISGLAVATAAVGGYLIYAGIRDVPLIDGLREIISGTPPTGRAQRRTAEFGVATDGVSGTSVPPEQGVSGTSVPGSGVSQAIAFARAQIGKPYVFGATGPNSYDCSGLIYAAYKSAGISIGRTTYQQIFNGVEVTQANLIPGDLVFPDIGHVQMYTGNGMIIQSPHTGSFVQEVRMGKFWRARRIVNSAVSGGGNKAV